MSAVQTIHQLTQDHVSCTQLNNSSVDTKKDYVSCHVKSSADGGENAVFSQTLKLGPGIQVIQVSYHIVLANFLLKKMIKKLIQVETTYL